MKSARYTDDQGNTILSYISSMPGFAIVPPGKTIDDAEHITEAEFHRDRIAREKKNPKPRDLVKEIDDLKAQIKELVANGEKLQKS